MENQSLNNLGRGFGKEYMRRTDIITRIQNGCNDIMNILSAYSDTLSGVTEDPQRYQLAVELLDKNAAEIRQHINGLRGYRFATYAATKLSSDVKKPIDASEVANQSTPFFQSRVVITGMLSSFPEREQLAMLLRKYGADINSSISAKTNIVIMGVGAGPSKMNKIQILKDKGIDIKVIEEPELLEIFEKYNIS